MKAELVNFELWFLDSDDRIQEDIDTATVHYALEDIKNAIATDNIDTVVGMLFLDGFLHRDREEFYDVLKKIEHGSTKLGIKKIYMIVGLCNGYQHELDKRNINIEIIDWSFPANNAYYAYKNVWNKIPSWNSNATKFMCTTGLPARANRIGIIKRLYENNLLIPQGIWSFFPPWTKEDKEWCRNYCSDYTNKQYKDFLKICTNTLDNKYDHAKNYTKFSGKELKKHNTFDSEFCKGSALIDPMFFQDSLISLISDGPTDGEQYNFFTEKLWRPIINNQPFILLESYERIQYAKSLGIKTFEEYTNFNVQGLDEEQRLDQTVASLKYFFNNYNSNIESIKQDIAHNKNIFLNLKKETDTLINWLINSLNIKEETIDKFIRTTESGVYMRFPKGV